MMTISTPIKQKCAYCGRYSEQIIHINDSSVMINKENMAKNVLEEMKSIDVKMCPRCKFASTNIASELGEYTKELINSNEYKSILKDKYADICDGYIYLAYAFLAQKEKLYVNAGKAYAKACKLFMESGLYKTARESQLNALNSYMLAFNQNKKDYTAICLLADTYRLIGDLTTAETLIKKVQKRWFLKKLTKQLLREEMQMCKDGIYYKEISSDDCEDKIPQVLVSKAQ